jgi:hypothetical protein
MSHRRSPACGKRVYFIAFLLGIQMIAMRIDSISVSNVCKGHSMRGSNTLTCFQACEHVAIEGGFQPPTDNVSQPPESVIGPEKNSCCSAELASAL